MTVTPEQQQAFIKSVADGAIAGRRQYGASAACAIAQAILESYYGQSQLALQAHNLFGMKGSGTNGSIKYPTTEFENGQFVPVTADFRAYHNNAESIEDHARLVVTNWPETKGKSGVETVQLLEAVPTHKYATDPNYVNQIKTLIAQFSLDQYDHVADAAHPVPLPAPGHNVAPAGGSISRDKIGTWTVKPGDSLTYIANETGRPLEIIQRANNIQDPNLIQAGASLKIPAMYRVRPGDNLSTICYNNHADLGRVALLNQIHNTNIIHVGDTIYLV